MPSDPLRLKVINRLVDVLKNIEEGTDYFYTPHKVAKGFIAEPPGYPIYMVTSESIQGAGGGTLEMHSDGQWDETYYIAISGIVQDAGDVVTPLERAIRDVRKAIDTDFRSGAPAGSLLTLATSLVFDDPPTIEYGFEGTGFFGYFSQRLKITVSGEFGEI